MATITVYKVLDPLTGVYKEVQTKEECSALVAELALSIFFSHTHNSPYSICEIHDNGTQTWRNAQGEEIIDPEELDKRIQEQVGAALSSIPPTSVEVLP